MEKTRILRLLSGPPLALQIVGLLVSGLVVAQLVTLLLTLLLPPDACAASSNAANAAPSSSSSTHACASWKWPTQKCGSMMIAWRANCAAAPKSRPANATCADSA